MTGTDARASALPTFEDAHRENLARGWLSRREGLLLFTAAREAKGRGAIVEIGSFEGRSTIYLALGSRAGAGGPVHAIDPHGGWPTRGDGATFAAFERNVAKAGVAALVRPIVATSDEAAPAWKDPIEVLFVDGDHSYEAVRRDLERWLPHLVPGGTLILHDATSNILQGFPGFPGVGRAFNELVLGSGEFEGFARHDTAFVCRRVTSGRGGASLGFRLRRFLPDLVKGLVWGLGLFDGNGFRIPGFLKRILERFIRAPAAPTH